MPISVRLDAELELQLDRLAKTAGRTKAALLREIIERGLEETEDYYLAADVLERVREGQEKTHSAARVRKSLRLDG